MTQIVIRGEVVYKCNICNRKIRVANNTRGLSVIYHCTITAGCKGKLNRVLTNKEILDTPAIPPEIPGVSDWFQRKLLYTHTQSVPSKEWTINHHLSNNPIFDVLINVGDAQRSYIPTIEPIDMDTTKLIFDKSYSGIAQAISLSSQQRITVPTVVTDDYVQVSNNSGLLTIATLDTSPILVAQVDYYTNTASNTSIHTIYNVDDNAQAASAWVDAQRVYINNHSYIVRTIDMVLDQYNYHYFTSNRIPSNSSIMFTTIDGLSITPKSVIILMSSSPYSNSDKIYDKIIYLDQVAINQLVYKNGAIFAHPSIIKNIYPYILVV